MTVLPRIFLPKTSEQDVQKEHRAVVLLSSPFALIKDRVISFLRNIPFTNVNLFFNTDSDFIMQRNLNGDELTNKLNKPISSLSYITECLQKELKDSKYVIHTYSLSLNALPLFYSILYLLSYHLGSYTRTSILRFSDSVLLPFSLNLSLCPLKTTTFQLVGFMSGL